MRKAFKILIPVVVIIGVLAFIGILANIPYVNTNVDEIAGVTNFVIIHNGSLYKLRFSLTDNDGYVAASDANVHSRDVTDRLRTLVFRHPIFISTNCN